MEELLNNKSLFRVAEAYSHGAVPFHRSFQQFFFYWLRLEPLELLAFCFM